MVESARQKGEELAAVYEEKLQARSRRNPEPYGRGTAESQHQIPEDLRRDGNHDKCTREEPQIFEETFAGIEKMREEMKRSASEVETFMKDPVKSIFPERQKKQPQSQAVKIPQKKQRKTKSSKLRSHRSRK